MKNTVLIVVHTNSWFPEMFRLAKIIAKDGHYEPLVQFAYPYPTLGRDQEILRQHGIRFGENKIPSSPLRIALRAAMRVLRARAFKVLGVVLNPLFETLHEFLFTVSEIKYFRGLIRKESAVLTVMAGDLVGYNCSELARASKLSKIPCIVVPSMMSEPIDQASAYYANPDFSCNRPLNALVTKIWPKWKFEYRGRELIRLPAEKAFVREILSLSPPLPWVFCSTIADAVAVESPAMYKYYRRFGIDESVLKLTGSPANDALFDCANTFKKADLLAEMEWEEGRKVILTALPPDTLYMPGGKPGCEFRTYGELVKFWIDALKDLHNSYVVVSLHPSVDKKDFLHLESQNLKISERPIVNLIPNSDLFVASVSSTIRWAIACSKPVLNYDVYKFGYQDFTGVPGVIIVEDRDEFSYQLQLLTEKEDYFSRQKALIASSASDWGKLDGTEGLKLMRFLDGYIEKFKERERWSS